MTTVKQSKKSQDRKVKKARRAKKTKLQKSAKAAAKGKPTRKQSKKKQPKKAAKAESAQVDVGRCQVKTATLTRCNLRGRERFCLVRTKQGRCESMRLNIKDQKVSTNAASKSKSLVIGSALSYPDIVVNVVPTGMQRLEFTEFKQILMRDIVLPNGVRNITFSKGTVDAYPSPKFRNITLPPSVREVSFRRVQMTSFNPMEWIDVPIETMRLENNLLSNFTNVKFPPTIMYLDLSNNRLTSFVNTTLPASLVSFRLHNNQLRAIDAIPIRSLPKLNRLILSDNPIEAIGATAALPPSLTDLEMSKCGLKTIDRAFRFPDRMRKLDLTDNNLTVFVPDLLPRTLVDLKLTGNPLLEFVIRDHAMLKQLRQMRTFEATTGKVTCNSTEYEKVVVTGQIFACMLKALSTVESASVTNAKGGAIAGNATPGMSSLTLVLIVACACSVVALVGAVVMLRHRQNRPAHSPMDKARR